MSTRSIIVVTDAKETKRIYKHCDGYPTDSLDKILNSIQKHETLDKIVEGIVLAMGRDFSVVEGKFEFPFKEKPKECLGTQGDLEWMYVVDVENKYVDVYKTNFKGNYTTFQRGTTDPINYLESIRDEFQRDTINTLKYLVKSIEKVGYLVNPPTNSVAFVKQKIKPNKIKVCN